MRRPSSTRALLRRCAPSAAWLAAAGCSSLGSVDLPEARAHPERTAPFDVEHTALAIELDPVAKTIAATARVRGCARADGLRELQLDLVDLEVHAVHGEHGEALEFAHQGGVLEVQLPRALSAGEFTECTVAYGGAPVRGLYFVDEEHGAATQVFTQGECEDSRGWFPCLDFPSERATSEIAVTLPAGWTSLAAGERLERLELDGGRAVERWRMTTPHPAYLTTLVAGDFATRTASWDGIPLVYVADPTLEPYLDARFEETPRVLEFFSGLTGVRYPYPKYGQAAVANFQFGGMENISATTLTDAWLVDERGARDEPAYGLLSHEAAHQWFGDLLTCRNWSHIWLNEGWATYATELYFEHSRGSAAFECSMAELREGFLAQDSGAARRPMLSDVYRDPMDLFTTGHAYPGGAARLHQLRFELGDEAFFAGVRRYFAEHRGRPVDTDDFRGAMEAASGLELSPFFDQWFRARGYPEFLVRWEWDEDARKVAVFVEQVHAYADGTPEVFTTPAEIELVPPPGDAGGVRTERVTITERRSQFTFDAAERPRHVLFDPHGWLLARVASERGTSEWVQIAQSSPHPLARREAVGVLARLARESNDARACAMYVEVVEGRLRGDEQAAVRFAAARSLAGLAPTFGREALEAGAARDEASRVRVACLQGLQAFAPDARLADFASAQYDAGYSWATMGAAAALEARARPERAGERFLERARVESPHDLHRAHLIAGMAGLDDARIVEALKRAAREGPPRTAEASARALARTARVDGDARQLIEALLEHPDYRVRSAAIDALAQVQDARSLPALRRAYTRLVDSRQRRAVEAILQAPWTVRS